MDPNTVSGTVYSSAGGNVGAGAVVVIAGITGTTDASGYYSIRTVPAGSNRSVSISEAGYVNYSGNITVNSGANNNVDFTMTANEVTGTVSSSFDGSTVSGATVTIDGISGTTNSGGIYTLYAVPAGDSENVTAIETGFLTFSGSTDVQSGLTTYNFTMTANPGNVTGTVTSSAGGVVSGAVVVVSGIEGTTDSNGVYFITGVPSGFRQNNICDNGRICGLQRSNQRCKRRKTTYDFTMTADPGAVTGTVYSSAGGNVGHGATVTIGGVTGTTDSNGVFSLSNVPAGNRTVTVSQVGYQNYTNSAIIPSGQSTLNLTMNANIVDGTVLSSAGGFVSGAVVTIDGVSGTTDTNGYFSIAGIPAGSSQPVNATRSGFITFSGSTPVSPGTTTTYNFTMTANPGTVTGTVSSSAGGYVSGAVVTIAGVSGTTDVNGVYSINGVPAGSNEPVSATKTGWTYSGANMTVASGQSTTFNFTMTADPGNYTGTISSSAGGTVAGA